MSSQTILQKRAEKTLWKIVSWIFKEYDTCGSGVLRKDQIKNMINDAFISIGTKKAASEKEVHTFINSVNNGRD